LLFGTSSLADEESFVSVAGSIFLPFKVKPDDHCRLDAVDSSVAGVSSTTYPCKTGALLKRENHLKGKGNDSNSEMYFVSEEKIYKGSLEKRFPGFKMCLPTLAAHIYDNLK
jgi:hypothetical protein